MIVYTVKKDIQRGIASVAAPAAVGIDCANIRIPNPQATDVDELTCYIAKNDLRNVRKIIKRNPEIINQEDLRNTQPIFEAVKRNQPKMIEFLVSKGANVNSTSKQDPFNTKIQQRASGAAVAGGGPNLLDLGLAVTGIGTNMTPLMVAAKQGNVEAFQTLMKLRANIALKDTEEKNVLAHLVESHVHNIYPRDSSGYNNLERKNVATRKMLREILNSVGKGADILNESVALNSTLITMAIERNDVEMVKLLLNYDPDLEQKDFGLGKGLTSILGEHSSFLSPLELAKKQGNLEIIQLIEEKLNEIEQERACQVAAGHDGGIVQSIDDATKGINNMAHKAKGFLGLINRITEIFKGVQRLGQPVNPHAVPSY